MWMIWKAVRLIIRHVCVRICESGTGFSSNWSLTKIKPCRESGFDSPSSLSSNWIWNHLGDTPMGVSSRVFPEKFYWGDETHPSHHHQCFLYCSIGWNSRLNRKGKGEGVEEKGTREGGREGERVGERERERGEREREGERKKWRGGEEGGGEGEEEREKGRRTGRGKWGRRWRERQGEGEVVIWMSAFIFVSWLGTLCDWPPHALATTIFLSWWTVFLQAQINHNLCLSVCLSLPLSVCMCVFMSMYMHECALPHSSHRRTLGVLLYYSLPYPLEARSLTEPGARLAASKPQRSSCPHLTIDTLSVRIMATLGFKKLRLTRRGGAHF
jgi:hypothetical protein